MSRLDSETKRKLREMNAGELLEAIDTQDETLSISLSLDIGPPIAFQLPRRFRSSCLPHICSFVVTLTPPRSCLFS